MFGLNIFMKDSGMAIIIAIVDMLVRVVIFRNALVEIARARVTTKKNHNLITIFHLYFIKINIKANASVKENIRERKDGVGSFSGVCNPKGRGFVVLSGSPVVGLISGEYAFTT